MSSSERGSNRKVAPRFEGNGEPDAASTHTPPTPCIGQVRGWPGDPSLPNASNRQPGSARLTGQKGVETVNGEFQGMASSMFEPRTLASGSQEPESQG